MQSENAIEKVTIPNHKYILGKVYDRQNRNRNTNAQSIYVVEGDISIRIQWSQLSIKLNCVSMTLSNF